MPEPILILFVLVGVIAFARWVLRQGWSIPAKVVCILGVVWLLQAITSSPAKGDLGSDHGILTDLIATCGIVIVTTWALPRVGADWRRQTTVVVIVLAMLLVIWVPRYLAGELTTQRRVAPVINEPEPVRVPPAHHESDEINCDELSYEGRLAYRCP